MLSEDSLIQGHALFISDLHLGSEKTSAPYLYEFLTRIDYSSMKDLYLVGDVIGGWENLNQQQRPFPEMEKRAVDALNYAVSQGVQVHFIPGNHDEKMRGVLPRLQARHSFSTFSSNLTFENVMTFNTGGPDSKKFKVLHGDQYDPALFNQKWFRPVEHLISATYDAIEGLDRFASRCTRWLTGKDIHFAKKISKGFSWLVDIFAADDDKRVNDLAKDGYDGVIMGHTHILEQKTQIKDGKTYYMVNSGDWVENASYAIAHNPGDMPVAVDYKAQRLQWGLKDAPATETAAEDPRFAALRDKTENQLRLVQMFWPAEDRRKVMELYNDAIYEINLERQERRKLREMNRSIRENGVIGKDMFSELETLTKTETNAEEKASKVSLRDLFRKYGSGHKVTKQDVQDVGRLMTEFMRRSCRNINARMSDLDASAQKLSFRNIFRSQKKLPGKIAL